MLYYDLWDKTSSINGVEASHFLENAPFKNYNGDIILIYSNSTKSKISQIECKDILADCYNIDATLSLDAFMTAYEEAITPKVEETTTTTETK